MESEELNSNNCENEPSVKVLKSATELQRFKLEKLMRNPNKQAFIPEPPKERKPRDPLEFIRNIWGSSAGAGSGDFHVYRGIRRREYARQKYVLEKADMDEKDAEFIKRVLENQEKAEEKTAKKRAKRLKKKEKQKGKKKKKPNSGQNKAATPVSDEESDDNGDEGTASGDDDVTKSDDNRVITGTSNSMNDNIQNTEHTENSNSMNEKIKNIKDTTEDQHLTDSSFTRVNKDSVSSDDAEEDKSHPAS